MHFLELLFPWPTYFVNVTSRINHIFVQNNVLWPLLPSQIPVKIAALNWNWLCPQEFFDIWREPTNFSFSFTVSDSAENSWTAETGFLFSNKTSRKIPFHTDIWHSGKFLFLRLIRKENCVHPCAISVLVQQQLFEISLLVDWGLNSGNHTTDATNKQEKKIVTYTVYLYTGIQVYIQMYEGFNTGSTQQLKTTIFIWRSAPTSLDL